MQAHSQNSTEPRSSGISGRLYVISIQFVGSAYTDTSGNIPFFSRMALLDFPCMVKKRSPSTKPSSNACPSIGLFAFRFRRISWKPMGDLYHIAHTHPLGGVDVPFGGYDCISRLEKLNFIQN